MVKHTLVIFLIAASVQFFRACAADGQCIWRGLCNNTKDDDALYCYKPGPPQSISDASLTKLLQACPEYTNPQTSNASLPVCCSSDQVEVFTSSLQQAKLILGSCPSCFANFRRLFCEMTCNPSQSSFLSATAVRSDHAITEVKYVLTWAFANGFYDSCANVQFGGTRAISIICDSSDCNAEKLLKALGKSKGSGGLAPFGINFTLVQNQLHYSPMNAPTYACNMSLPALGPNPSQSACACSDCPAACPPPDFPTPDKQIYVFGFPLSWLLVAVLFVVGFSAFTVWQVFVCRRNRRLAHEASRGDTELLISTPTAEASAAKRANWQRQLGAAVDRALFKAFSRLGLVIAQHPIATLLFLAIIIAFLCGGLTMFTVTTNPIELWSDRGSRARQEKDYFDAHFGPFYRIEQLILRPANRTPVKNGTFGPAFRKDFLDKVLDLQLRVAKVVAYDAETKENVFLADICFKPMEPEVKECGVTSPLEYFQHNATLFNSSDYLLHLEECTGSVLKANCLGSSGLPQMPNVVFGGFKENYTKAEAAVITFLVRNSAEPKSPQITKCLAWESAYLEAVREWMDSNGKDVIVSYSAERSVEDEIKRQSDADVQTVLISYVVMFIYVSLFLGAYTNCRSVPVDLKVTLGLGGVLIVLASVAASVGLWSYVGVPATLIIIEVVPFLVLAVGVDNIFILVQDYQLAEFRSSQLRPRVQEPEGAEGEALLAGARDTQCHLRSDVHARVAQTLGRVGPSMLLSSAAESVAFFCGSMTTMPAVRVFALYAGVALVINFLLQLFAFTALLTLDARRAAARKWDVLCCVKSRPENSGTATVEPNPTSTGPSEQQPEEPQEGNSAGSGVNSENPEYAAVSGGTWLYQAVSRCLSPVILSKWIRPILMVVLFAWICICVALVTTNLEVGLDQRLSMPLDSYVLDYFDAMAQYLAVGPPVYFVVTRGHNYTSWTSGQSQVCSVSGCPNTSLPNLVSVYSKYAQQSYIASPPMVWIDQYFNWFDQDDKRMRCCRVLRNNTDIYCNSTDNVSDCVACGAIGPKKPAGEDFNRFIMHFLQQLPDASCPFGGKAAFSSAVETLPGGNTTNVSVGATHFMTYHTVLREPHDYVEALRVSRWIAKNLTDSWKNSSSPNLSDPLADNIVFPYSVFYVFYEQYIGILHQTAVQLSVCLAAIAVITLFLLGLNFVATFIVFLGVACIDISLLGLMSMWNINLNAISLVNLVVCTGIAVEFCSHIVRAYTQSCGKTRIMRAHEALSEMGSSVLRGITLTKLGGIVVLAFSNSRLFQVFYFRMYLGMVVFGALIGIIFLPVILSYIGPSLNPLLVNDKKHHENEDFENQPDETAATSGRESPITSPANNEGENQFQATGWGSNRL
uniref:SSD domain-containing protein n=1 Tax=Mesocestoides corti TaxID=53468 RepID=A0A5K3F8N3_MESCO